MNFLGKYKNWTLFQCKIESVAYERGQRENNTSSELLYGGQADKAPASFGALSR